MATSSLDRYIIEMRNGGRKQKKSYIQGMVNDWPEYEWRAGLLFLSGAYTSSGIAKKSAIDAIDGHLVDDFEARVAEHGTVTEALRESDFDGGHNGRLWKLKEEIENDLSQRSGHTQIDGLRAMLQEYSEPHLVTFALLDDWQTGVTETTIANALGEDAGATKDEIQRARSLEPDPVSFALAVEEDRFDDLLEPQAGKPFKPMKAIREKYLDDLLDRDTPVYAEPKLDGYRLLVHVESGDVTAYTRRLKDATDSVPELQEIDWPDGEWIIDGEVLATDGEYSTTSEMVGSNQERAMDDRGENVVFHAFDLLLDGEHGDQTQRRYEKRRAGLVLLFREIDSPWIEIVRAFGFDDGDDPVEAALDYAEDNGLEGIIVKDGASEYQFGKRSKSWVKQKLTEVTVDLVMASFEVGEGDNAGTLGGMRLETADGQYVGNVGNGVSDELRDEIWQNRDEYRGETVEITFEGLGTNDELRFPRIERLRVDDGEPDDFDRLKGLAEQV